MANEKEDKKKEVKKEAKSDASNSSSSSLAPSSSLVIAPKSIAAGTNGNVIIQLTNPTKDTLRLQMFADMPDGWSFVNTLSTITLDPISSKAVVVMLVPSNQAVLGLTDISFNFVDAKNQFYFDQDVIIDVAIRRRLIVRESSGISVLAKGGEGITLSYLIINAGNVNETFSIEKEFFTLAPSDSTRFYKNIRLSQRSTLRNYYDKFVLQKYDFVGEDLVETTKKILTKSLAVYGDGIDKPYLGDLMPFEIGSRVEGRSNNAINNYTINQSFSGLLFNSKKTDFLSFNANYFTSLGGIGYRNQVNGKIKYTKDFKNVLHEVEVGRIPLQGYFFFRLPSSMITASHKLTSGQLRLTSSIGQQLLQFSGNDSMSNLSQIRADYQLNEAISIYTHQLRSGYSNSSRFTSINGAKFESVKSKLLFEFLAHSKKDLSLSLGGLALRNEFENSGETYRINVQSFISGKDFNPGSENLRRLSYSASKIYEIFSFNVSQEIFEQQPLNSSMNAISRNTCGIRGNTSVKSIKGSTSFRRISNTINIQNKVATSITQTFGADLRYTSLERGSLRAAYTLSQQQARVDNIASGSDLLASSTRVDYASPQLSKNSFQSTFAHRRARNTDRFQISTDINRDVSKSLGMTLGVSGVFNPSNTRNNMQQSSFGLSYRKGGTSIALRGNAARLGNGLMNYGGSINAIKKFNLSKKDTANYKRLEGQILSSQGEPISNVLIYVNNHTLITDGNGEFYCHDFLTNETIISVDENTLPFGMKCLDASSFTVFLLKTRNNIVIKTFEVGEISGSSRLERTGLLKEDAPVYTNYFVQLRNPADSSFNIISQLNKNGEFRIANLSPGHYQMEVKCASSKANAWKLKEKYFELDVKDGETISHILTFTDKVSNLKIQKFLPSGQ